VAVPALAIVAGSTARAGAAGNSRIARAATSGVGTLPRIAVSDGHAWTENTSAGSDGVVDAARCAIAAHAPLRRRADQRGPITTVYSATDNRGSARGLFGSRPTGDLWQSYTQTESTGPGELLAGNALVLSLGSGLNDASLIGAGGELLIAGDAFTNQAHQLLTTVYHTWYRWKSKLLGRKEAVTDVYYEWRGTPATVQAGGELRLAEATELGGARFVIELPLAPAGASSTG